MSPELMSPELANALRLGLLLTMIITMLVMGVWFDATLLDLFLVWIGFPIITLIVGFVAIIIKGAKGNDETANALAAVI